MKIRFNKIIVEIDAETETTEIRRLAKAVAVANGDESDSAIMHIYAQLLAWQAHMIEKQKYSE